MTAVNYKYFDTNKKVVEEINLLDADSQNQLKVLENKVSDLEAKNNELVKKMNNNKMNENLSPKIDQKKNYKG